MITLTETMRKTWSFLISSGMTPAGAAGMLGNLYAESGIIPNRVEILCLQRLREIGKIYTDATYTAFVDDGTISREEFLHPLPGRQYGFGLAQWTAPSRKAGLYDLCKRKGLSIGDLGMQLEYLLTELNNSYQGVLKVLTTTNDIETASDRVLMGFECPDDTSAGVKKTRQGYAREFYNAYAVGGEKMTPVEKVIGIAKAEEGYLEKRSNSQLDEKTANPGSGNFTKYWRDVYPAFQGQAWCAVFVAWCFMKAFGLEVAKKMLKHWPFVYCPTLAGMTSNKTPHVGDVVLFYRNGEYAHTGLVIAVTASQITTVEGNTSTAPGVVANGGGVCRKTYQRSAMASQTKFFQPDYSLAGDVSAPSLAQADLDTAKAAILKGDQQVTLKWFVKGAVDPQIEKIQLILNYKGYKGKNGQPMVVDGELGEQTMYAITTLQKEKGFPGTTNFGTVAANTWRTIMDL